MPPTFFVSNHNPFFPLILINSENFTQYISTIFIPPTPLLIHPRSTYPFPSYPTLCPLLFLNWVQFVLFISWVWRVGHWVGCGQAIRSHILKDNKFSISQQLSIALWLVVELHVHLLPCAGILSGLNVHRLPLWTSTQNLSIVLVMWLNQVKKTHLLSISTDMSTQQNHYT